MHSFFVVDARVQWYNNTRVEQFSLGRIQYV